MRLISCYIEGFGSLRQMKIDFEDGLNCFVKGNGWGKSTFAAFIRVMFYGFDGESKRNEFENERKYYRPWSGNVYGGELVFKTGERKYRLQRVFGTKKSEDNFALYDGDTNMPSDDFSENIGAELFQIDAQSFQRSVYIGQNECETWTTDGINAKIGNISDESADINNYDKACGKLKNVMNLMSPSKKTGELYKQKQDILTLKEKTRREGTVAESIENLRDRRYSIERMRSISSEYQHNIAEKNKAAKYFPGKIPERNELQNKIEQARQYEKVNAYLGAMEIERIGIQKGEKFLILCAVVVLVVMVMLKTADLIGNVLFALGLVVSLFNLVTVFIIRNRKISAYKETQNPDRDVPEIRIQKDFQRKKESYKKITEKCEKTRQELNQYIERLGFVPDDDILYQLIEIQNKLKDYEFRCQAVTDILSDETMRRFGKGYQSDSSIDSQIAECDMELAELTAELEDIKEAEVMLKQQRSEFEQSLRKYGLINRTYELLGQAKIIFTTKYTEPVMKSFTEYYECITDRHEDIQMNAEMDISYRNCGMYRDKNTLSAGLKDLTNICERLAVTDAMYPNERPVLIMDDPFVNLDDQNMAGAKKLLSLLGKKYQIIYFTCSKNRVL